MMNTKRYINKIITGLTFVGFAMNLMYPAAMAASYTDVPSDHWAIEVINQAADAGEIYRLQAMGDFQI